MITYTTASGDTWDSIAFKVYGNVKYTEFLMSSNQIKVLLEIVVFDSGTIVSIPALPISTLTDPGTPPWRL